jgi:Chaperone of endosialidase
MANERQRPQRLCGTIGCARAVVFLTALAAARTAAAQNTYYGIGALNSDTTGTDNSAFGYDALYSNTTGSNNSALGYDALLSNVSGEYNTALGSNSLLDNTVGFINTAVGYGVLADNTSGDYNTAVGFRALAANTTGEYNMAFGLKALFNNTEGSNNAAIGSNSLFNNTTGGQNFAGGYDALLNVTTGMNNLGLGYLAGQNVVAGVNNIEIGGSGTADESNTIRIGTNGTQTATYIAGIDTTGVSGSDVEVDSNGQLGVTQSSARYKRDIHDMGDASAGLLKLRPVTFHYKNDQSQTLQYGLVAEEVAKVYPELVTHDADGKIESVRYLELTGMLLNELQKQTRDSRRQTIELQQLNQQHRKLGLLLAEARTEQTRRMNTIQAVLDQRISALERAMHTESSPVTIAAVHSFASDRK